MHIDHISFEPNSSYVAEGKHSMGGGASITNYQLTIDTDTVGRIRRYSDRQSDDKSLADMWDYQKLRNVRTGKVWDLRLHNAASTGKSGVAQVALAEGADVTLRMKQGATALHWAAAKGHEDVAKLLVEHGADVNATDELGWSPVFLADANGFSALVKFFIEHGAKTKAIICGKEASLSTEANPDGDLIEAAESGDFETAKSSLDAGADVNCKSRDGWMPLLIASKDYTEIVELLLANGADPNVASDRGYTPLMRAAGNGNERVVRLLLAAGADKRMVDLNGKTANQLALEMRHLQCAQLVEPGEYRSERAPHEASQGRPTELLGSDLNDAAQKGNLKEVEALLRKGADIHWKNPFGETALYKACESGHTAVAAALLAAGADCNTRRLRTVELTVKGAKDAISIFGETALITAAQSGHTEAVQLLVDAGADLDAMREDGCTALILAAHSGETDTVRALMRAGADMDVKMAQGITAAQAARAAGHSETADLIEGLPLQSQVSRNNLDRKQSRETCAGTRNEILAELLDYYRKNGPNNFVPPRRLKAFQKHEGAAFAALSILFREGFISGIFEGSGDMADLDFVATVELLHSTPNTWVKSRRLCESPGGSSGNKLIVRVRVVLKWDVFVRVRRFDV